MQHLASPVSSQDVVGQSTPAASNARGSVRPESSSSNAPDRPRPKGPSAKRKRIIQEKIVTEPLPPLISLDAMNGFNTASGSGPSSHVPPSEVAKTSSRTRARQSAAGTSSGAHGTSIYSSDVVPLTVPAKDRKEKFPVTQRTLEVAGKIAELGEVQQIKCFACAEAEIRRVLALEEFMGDQARGNEPDITVEEKDKLFSPIVCFYYDPAKLGIIKGVRMTNSNYGRCSNCMTEGRGCWWPTESLAPGLQAATAMAAYSGATAGPSHAVNGASADDSSKRSSRRSDSQRAQDTPKPRKATAKRKSVITAARGSMMAIESEPLIRPIPDASSSVQPDPIPLTSRPASPACPSVPSFAQPIVPRSPSSGVDSQVTQPGPYNFNSASAPQLQELQQPGVPSNAQAVEPEAELNSDEDETEKALAAALAFMQNQALRGEYGDMDYTGDEPIQDGEIGLMEGADSGVDFGLSANEQVNPGRSERGDRELSGNEQVTGAQESIGPSNEAPTREENVLPSVSNPRPQSPMRNSTPAQICDPSPVLTTVEQQPAVDRYHQTTSPIQPGDRERQLADQNPLSTEGHAENDSHLVDAVQPMNETRHKSIDAPEGVDATVSAIPMVSDPEVDASHSAKADAASAVNENQGVHAPDDEDESVEESAVHAINDRAQESAEDLTNDHAKEPVVGSATDSAEDPVVDSTKSTEVQQPAEASANIQLTSHVGANAEGEEDHRQTLSTEETIKDKYSFLFDAGDDGMDIVQEETVVLGARHSDLVEESAMNNGRGFGADVGEMAVDHGEALDTVAEGIALKDGGNRDTAGEDTPMNHENAPENAAGEMVIDEPQNLQAVAEPADEINMNGNEDVVTAVEELPKNQEKAPESAPEDVVMDDVEAFGAAPKDNATNNGEVHQSAVDDHFDTDRDHPVDTIAIASENQKEMSEQEEYMNGLSEYKGQGKPQGPAPEATPSSSISLADTDHLDFVPETQRDPIPDQGPATLPVAVSEPSEAPPVITAEAMPAAVSVTAPVASAGPPAVLLIEDGIQVTVTHGVRKGGEVVDETDEVVVSSTVAAAETRQVTSTGRTRSTRSTRAAAKAIKKSLSTTNKHKGRSYATPNGGHGSTFGIPSEPPEFHLTPKWLDHLPRIPKADIVIQESSVPLKQDNRNLMSLDIPGVNKVFRKCTGCTLRECPCAPLPIEPENRETKHAKYWQNSVLDSAGCLTCRICGVICSFQLDPPIYGDYATLPSPRTLDNMKLLPKDWDNRSALDGFDGEEQVDETGYDQSAGESRLPSHPDPTFLQSNKCSGCTLRQCPCIALPAGEGRGGGCIKCKECNVSCSFGVATPQPDGELFVWADADSTVIGGRSGTTNDAKRVTTFGKRRVLTAALDDEDGTEPTENGHLADREVAT